MTRSAIVAALLLTACPSSQRETPAAPASAGPEANAEPTPAPATAAPKTKAGGWAKVLPADAAPRTDLAKLGNLDRLPGLTDEHRRHLKEHGFFVTAQSVPDAKPDSSGAARDARRAKHLFQVYERNDYIRFPSYVTVDLAIDLTHQYFDVVLRQLERDELEPKLRVALKGFTEAALADRKAAKTAAAKDAATAAAAYWGTALRLLEQRASGDEPDVVSARPPWWGNEEMMAEMAAEYPPAAQPSVKVTKLDPAIDKTVAAAATKVIAAAAVHEFPEWGQKLDLTQTKPRSHYAGDGVLQRYFRAMSFLGLTRFDITGEQARPELLLALARSATADDKARKAYADVLQLTNFVVGQPPTKGMVEAAAAVKGLGANLDEALQKGNLEQAVTEWSKFPAHPIAGDGPVVQPIGQRVFADTLAMSKLLPVLRDLDESRGELVKRTMGAAGSAAMLGSDTAQAIVLDQAGDQRARIEAGLGEGRGLLTGGPKGEDAYHDTLRALTSTLSVDPLMYEPEGYGLRMLQTFAGGWAMLRHDTLLYAYAMGAECDAEDLEAPYGWIEPYPEVYAGLRTMVEGFSTRLKDAGISMAANEEENYDNPHYSIGTKTEALIGYLKKMEDYSRQELAGKPFDEDQRTAVAMIGGHAEHVVLTLADAFELGDGNDDMAVIADVFTFRGQALEVGVGHPELIYAVIPTPKGWTIARGAVMSYREFFVPAADRMTDEDWRKRMLASKDFEAAARPKWLAPIVAPPIGVIGLPADGSSQSRCEYYGGYFEI